MCGIGVQGLFSKCLDHNHENIISLNLKTCKFNQIKISFTSIWTKNTVNCHIFMSSPFRIPVRPVRPVRPIQDPRRSAPFRSVPHAGSPCKLSQIVYAIFSPQSLSMNILCKSISRHLVLQHKHRKTPFQCN